MLGLLVMLIEGRIYHLIKLLLYTAKEENAKVCATRLQKVFFLLEKETGKDLGLELKPLTKNLILTPQLIPLLGKPT